MKHHTFVVLVLGVVFVLSLPFAACAQDKANYIVGKAGIYIPTDDLDDFGFDNGFNGEVAFGHYFHRNFALEAGFGYFESDMDMNGDFIDSVLGWHISGTVRKELDVISLTLTAKGLYPINNAELYAGAGIGVYFASLDIDASGFINGMPGFGVSTRDDYTVFGGHVVLGGNFNITDNIFLGMEGKYIFTGNMEYYYGVDIALNGFRVTGNIGCRF